MLPVNSVFNWGGTCYIVLVCYSSDQGRVPIAEELPGYMEV